MYKLEFQYVDNKLKWHLVNDENCIAMQWRNVSIKEIIKTLYNFLIRRSCGRCSGILDSKMWDSQYGVICGCCLEDRISAAEEDIDFV